MIDALHRTRYWHTLDDGRVQCDLCPRYCKLREGQRGFCFVRARHGDAVVLTAYGRSTGFSADPIEKKPLFHFLPGSAVLSFGTAGCNLGCKYCQNWDISKATDDAVLSSEAAPRDIAETALRHGCRSVAFTYNEPTIFMEYAVDAARAAHRRGLKTIAVTNGYITEQAREDFFAWIDAANVDLKGFTEDFYRKVCGAHLGTVLETLQYLVQESSTWVEVTTLLIPGYNDSDAELDAMTQWLARNLGPDVPLHFTAFRPAWKMTDVPPTPPETLKRAHGIAVLNGLRYVYTGNVHDPDHQTTHCTTCHTALIRRDWHRVMGWHLNPDGTCPHCGTLLPGNFEHAPGDALYLGPVTVSAPPPEGPSP